MNGYCIMQRQAITFFIIISVFCAYYFVKMTHFSTSTAHLESEKRVVVVGTNAEYKPFSFIDEKGEIVGFDIDVMDAIAQKIDIVVNYKDLPFDALIGELLNGTIDCMIGGINPTPERSEKVFFTHPVYANDPLVIVYQKNGKAFNGIKDLANAKVIVNEGYFADSFLSQQGDIALIRLSSNLPSDGLLALYNGQADAFVGSKSTTLQALTQKQKAIFDYIVIDQVVEQDAFAVSKNNLILLTDINKAIKLLKSEGIIGNLTDKWFLNKW